MSRSTSHIVLRRIVNTALFASNVRRGLLSIPPTSGRVDTAASPITATVASLLGGCLTAGFAVEPHIAATINDGWNRHSEYDAEASLGFVPTP
jgi:hypothetical protein